MKKTLITIACLTLSACTSAPDIVPKIQSVENSQYSPYVTISGAPGFVNPFGGTNFLWMIRSYVNKQNGEVKHQLYVSLTYLRNWKYFEMASDDNAQTLELTKISADVNDCSLGSCSFTEAVGVNLTSDQLKKNAEKGFSIQLAAISGDKIIVPITPVQIQMQLGGIAAILDHNHIASSDFPPVAKSQEPKATNGH